MAHDVPWWEKTTRHALVIEACSLLLDFDNVYIAGLLDALRKLSVRKSRQRRKPPASSSNAKPLAFKPAG